MILEKAIEIILHYENIKALYLGGSRVIKAYAKAVTAGTT